MPSLKRSETRRRTHGGADPAERLVREAIAFLFEIKGEEYRKKHPEFITPTADEFFSYARTVNDALESTRVKKGGVHRKLPIPKYSGGSNIIPFLEFIVPGPIDVANPCETILSILKIFLIAVMVYKFVVVFMRVQAENPGRNRATLMANVQSVLADPEYVDSFSDPVRWFCSKFLPVFNTLRDNIQVSIAQIVQYISGGAVYMLLIGRFQAQQELAAWVIGKAFASGLNYLHTDPLILKTLFYIPLFCQLAIMGFEGCGELCMKFIGEAKIGKFIKS